MAKPIVISILANASQARAELNSTGGKFSRFGGLAKAGFAIAGVAAAGFAVSAVKAASDAQQSIGATETVFGKYAQTVVKTSDKAARAYGLSANAYRENANLIGSLFKNQGVSTDKLAGKTEGMIATAADLSATFGGSTKSAVEALGSAFKGEFDPLEKYGISLKQSTVNAEASALAQKQYGKELGKLSTKQQTALKQQATSNLIAKQSKDSTGAFARETKTLAHQQQVLGAQFDNIKTKVGTALLPILTRFLTFLNNNGPAAFEAVRSAIQPVIAFFQRLGGESDGLGGKFQEYLATAKSVWASVQSVISSAVVIITALWQRFGGIILSTASTVFSAVLSIIRGAWTVIQGIFNVFAGILSGDWSRVWTGIKQILSGAVGIIKGLVRGLWAIVRGIFSAGGTAIKAVFVGAWNGIKSAASTGISALISKVKAIPGKIKSGLGNLKNLLLTAGKEIIGGLLRGILEKAEDMYNKVKGIGDKIKSLKGPLSYDKVMLKPEGKAIIQGLIDGMASEENALFRQVSSISDKLGKTKVGTPTLAFGKDGDLVVAAGAARNVVVNNYFDVRIDGNMTEVEMGRAYQRAINAAKKVGAI